MCSHISTCDAKIVLITETWLHPDINDIEILPNHSNFTFYRRDRKDRRGGGVLICIDKSIKSTLLFVSMSIEAIWVSVKCGFKSILVGVCYRPPDASSSFVTSLHDELSILFTQHPGHSVFLVGDFNFREINWNLSDLVGSGSSGECRDFISLCLDFNLSQMISFPTRVTTTCSNILDLLLTNHPKSITSLTGFEGISDHKAVFYNLGFQAPERQVDQANKAI